MFTNVECYVCADANCVCFFEQLVQAELEAVHAGPQGMEASGEEQEFAGQWDCTSQIMYYPVPIEMNPAAEAVEVWGTTYYATPASSGSMADGYSEMPEEEWNMEMQQTSSGWFQAGGTTYYPPAFEHQSTSEEAPITEIAQNEDPLAPIQIGGTTFYPQTSGSSTSGHSSLEEGSSSPPMEFDAECNWMDEMEQSLPIINDFVTLHQVLETLVLKEDQMKEAGFPAMDEQRKVIIQPTFYERGTKMWIEENEPLRRCSRCHVTFAVGADGRFPTGPGICQVTFKKQRKEADQHITMQRFASELEKFAETPAPIGEEDDRSNKIFALDVEMVSTTAGPALARLSVVDFDGQLVLDVIVKPEAQVVDCLTEFSGITMEMLDRATNTLESCRELFFNLVNSRSILVGHGLDGDLKALRVVHQRVIDTSILYQDERNRKVALRVLAKQHLDRTIQTDNSSTFGHCSEEDALASLDLVKHRIGLC